MQGEIGGRGEREREREGGGGRGCREDREVRGIRDVEKRIMKKRY